MPAVVPAVRVPVRTPVGEMNVPRLVSFAAVRLRDGKFLFRREIGRFNGETFWEFLKVFREVSVVPRPPHSGHQ